MSRELPFLYSCSRPDLRDYSREGEFHKRNCGWNKMCLPRIERGRTRASASTRQEIWTTHWRFLLRSVEVQHGEGASRDLLPQLPTYHFSFAQVPQHLALSGFRKSCLNPLCSRGNCVWLHYYPIERRGLDAHNTCCTPAYSHVIAPLPTAQNPCTTDQVRMATGFLKEKCLETPKVGSYTRAAR
jgi:hypothetical protein